MSYYARTKEFTVSIQPGDQYTEAIPIKGSKNIIATRLNTTNSFCSSSSFYVYPYVSYDNETYRQPRLNVGNGYAINTTPYYGKDQNNEIYDYNFTDTCAGFNFLKIASLGATATATALFRVLVVF